MIGKSVLVPVLLLKMILIVPIVLSFEVIILVELLLDIRKEVLALLERFVLGVVEIVLELGLLVFGLLERVIELTHEVVFFLMISLGGFPGLLGGRLVLEVGAKIVVELFDTRSLLILSELHAFLLVG